MIRAIQDLHTFEADCLLTVIMNTQAMDIGVFMENTTRMLGYEGSYKLEYEDIRDCLVNAVKATGKKSVVFVFSEVPLNNDVQWHYLQEIFSEVSSELKKSGVAFSVEVLEDE